jgi:hypothetical protein
MGGLWTVSCFFLASVSSIAGSVIVDVGRQ